jgi:hypothetical protein
MPTRSSRFCLGVLMVALSWASTCASASDEPKPTSENTISIQVGDPVPAQKFDHAPKFWIAGVIDRSGTPQPLLVTKLRGGIFIDKQPTAIVKDSLEQSLKAANLLATDEASADLVLRVYIFQFGLASGSGFDFFGKVEFSTIVKNPKTGESTEIKAAGTSIANGAVRKKNLQKNVEENIEMALRDATRNFLRGAQLKETVASLSKPTDSGSVAGLESDPKPQQH